MYAPVAGEIVETNDESGQRGPERRLQGAGGRPLRQVLAGKIEGGPGHEAGPPEDGRAVRRADWRPRGIERSIGRPGMNAATELRGRADDRHAERNAGHARPGSWRAAVRFSAGRLGLLRGFARPDRQAPVPDYVRPWEPGTHGAVVESRVVEVGGSTASCSALVGPPGSGLLVADRRPFGGEDLDRGLEPDECYYIANAHRMRRAARTWTCRVDPPPDLAVEIDVTQQFARPHGHLRGAGRPGSLAVRRRRRSTSIILQEPAASVRLRAGRASLSFPTLAAGASSSHFLIGTTQDLARLRIASRRFRAWVRAAAFPAAPLATRRRRP